MLLFYQFCMSLVYAESRAAVSPHEPVILLLNSNITITHDANQALLALPLDEQDSTITPSISQGSVMAPLRFIAEHFGAKVFYHDDQSIDVLWKDRTLTLFSMVYLSFDDGPNGYTPVILDILSAYDIKAAFFMLGSQIDQHPNTVKRIVNEGHAVGLHGVTHNQALIYRTPQTVVSEMNDCNLSLKKAAGVTTHLIRVPYGSVPYMKQDYRNAVVQAGYRMWDWNVDSTDSLGADTDTIIKKTIQQVSSKDSAIILFHDKKTTSQALPVVLDYLIEHGYDFNTIDSGMTPINFWKDTR